ncbi:siderophore-interacting protein [Luteimicrobium subarcticum]|uniref:NADPH-dependent ferric siderophore reductase n=1 Tax=Luteimicrobium subarcticum TaxID=620910 RepID=A0A2M8WUH0_9MICO|nr:siderophore-interacting protein [Luteimicrobium subarcticum]PJI94580.1 NADPH-dependent ferric siderophore reductase [Luteimicrobium subarcticum]
MSAPTTGGGPGGPGGRGGRGGPPQHATVTRTERLTDHLVRVWVGGPDVVALDPGPYSDRYVKLVFPDPDAVLGPDGEAPRPLLRTYTIAVFDASTGEMALDFVVHDDGPDAGVAAPWAVAAQPGDTVAFRGPGGGYAPSAGASWHLLIGDDSALPALAAAVAVLPPGARAHVLCEVAGPRDEIDLHVPDGTDVTVHWVHRGHGPVGSALAGWLADATLPGDAPDVFLHGEATMVRALRRHLREERGYAREALVSVSGYWRAGRTDEGWRAEKREWNEAVEADDARVA